MATGKITLTTSEKILVGALGGLAAVCVKFLGQDYNTLIEQGANLSADQVFALKVGYGVLTPILVFLGAILAWVSEESNRLKLLAIGIAAPALITTWSGGNKPDASLKLSSLSPVSISYAKDSSSSSQTFAIKDPMQRSYGNWWEASVDGIKMFFGYGKEIKQYYVVVGSFKNRDQASSHAKAVNERNPRLNAHIGSKTSNGFYPVILGDSSLLSVADRTRKQVNTSRIVTDAYLMPADEMESTFSFAFSN